MRCKYRLFGWKLAYVYFADEVNSPRFIPKPAS